MRVTDCEETQMSRKARPMLQSYRIGLLLVGSAFFVGFIGVAFLNDALSAKEWLTYGFVGMVTAIGLAGAAVIARAFFVRHDPFRRL